MRVRKSDRAVLRRHQQADVHVGTYRGSQIAGTRLLRKADVAGSQARREENAEDRQHGENGEKERFAGSGQDHREHGNGRGTHDGHDGQNARAVRTCLEEMPFGCRCGTGIACLAFAHEWKRYLILRSGDFRRLHIWLL